MAGRILIVDDVATNRIVLKVKLASAYYHVLQANDGAAALRSAREDSPDLILLDIMMPDMDGVAVCEALKSDPLTAHIPIIIVTSHREDAEKFRALRAGADDFMSKPLDEMTLLARIRSLLRARDTQEELRLRDSTCRELGFAETQSDFSHSDAEKSQGLASIALIAAHQTTALKWKSNLQKTLAAEIKVIAKEDALSQGDTELSPDVFVIETDLAGRDDGLRLLSELRSRPETRHSAIIMITPDGRTNSAATSLDMGANDLITAGFSNEELTLRLQTQIKRKKMADRLRDTVRDGLRMAVIDPLTGLFNRRYALPHLARISERARTTGRPFAVMIADIDRFKSVNDTYGHAAGDTVLQHVSALIKENLRGVDMVARIGGEEFLIAMPDTDLTQAQKTAERLCELIGQSPINIPNKQLNIPVSVSIGVALGVCGEKTNSIEQLIENADRALFHAKSEGRNKVTVWQSAA